MVAALGDAQVGGVAGGQPVAVPLGAESNGGIPHLSWAGQGKRAGRQKAGRCDRALIVGCSCTRTAPPLPLLM